mmetsp:Transcript_53897/g.163733  ORF Transcript_53897/g.163733 Transcript_53897/m.163733 type:complete len:206 (+) Transcript_53897:590-1207(+)
MSPGASRNSSSVLRKPPILCHVSFFVDPASPLFGATFRPTKRLINVDLPMLGMPSVITRMARGLMPLRWRLLFTNAPDRMSSVRSSSRPSWPLFMPSTAITGMPLSCSDNGIALMLSSSACAGTRSRFIRTMTRGFPRAQPGTSGCAEVNGKRASRTSMTTSILLRTSRSILNALTWCIGRQLSAFVCAAFPKRMYFWSFMALTS